MRKIKNNIQMENPALSFARGVESLISDSLYHPSRQDREDIARARRAAGRPDARGNLFGALLKQFANH